MGRFVSGDWDWKFAFGDQSSSLGEVLETICEDLEETYCDRYIGKSEQGEYVELYLGNVKEFVESCKEFIGKDFVVKDEEKEGWTTGKVHFGNDYWDKLMIRKLLKDKKEFEGEEGETFNFYVEY
jgi:hypothetical protein